MWRRRERGWKGESGMGTGSGKLALLDWEELGVGLKVLILDFQFHVQDSLKMSKFGAF